MKDRTLVVGATGHVGSQVVKILANQGQNVRATATALIPTNRKDSVSNLNLGGYDTLIAACERAGVRAVSSRRSAHPRVGGQADD